MKRPLLFFAVLVLLIPFVNAEDIEKQVWTKDLQNGYISTAPLIVEEVVIVRSSGFWTGQERPQVYALDLGTGETIWQVENRNSTQHDMSPLLHVKSGQGCGGEWPDMVLVGWTDGLVEALQISDGSRIWASQTEVVTWGVTGAMAIDDDKVVVPTRQGLSVFCLGDGSQSLRVDLPQLGWRNGVTVTEEFYLLGNEQGVLNTIYKNGTVVNQSIGDGMIRHAPIVTSNGVLVHLQTQTGSNIFVNNVSIHQSGYSPAIPIMHQNRVYAATSTQFITIDCTQSSCVVEEASTFHSNGEISIEHISSSEYNIWAPSNTPEGGWGIFSSNNQTDMFTTIYDTYTTAGVAFGDGAIALGSDSGVLYVEYSGMVSAESSIDYFSFFLIVSFGLLYCWAANFAVANDWAKVSKITLVMLLLVAVYYQPQISSQWSNWVDDEFSDNDGWEPPWGEDNAEECEGYQAVTFQLDSKFYLVCGLEDFENVEDITDFAAQQESITVEKEDHQLGPWIKSFNGEKGDGWEFYIDGKRSMVGISEAELKPTSVVEWRMA
tara:strand:- start:1085 stop:2725 length:1641 start_codon:yes stop_codon:yes gene_type:complete